MTEIHIPDGCTDEYVVFGKMSKNAFPRFVESGATPAIAYRRALRYGMLDLVIYRVEYRVS